MALVSPYDTALIHEFSRREAVRLLSESLSSTAASSAPHLQQVPPESFFASLPGDGDATTDSGIPSIQACAVHLELLETFVVLRRKVILSNALSATLGHDQNYTCTAASLEKRRSEKWEKFVHLAVARFKIWLKYIQEDDQRRQAIQHQFGSMLPPIDVLMVLHAFMLNPREYRAYFAHVGVASISMLDLRFPWKAIHDSLDIHAGAYRENVTLDASLDEIMHIDLLKFLQDPKSMDGGTRNCLSDTPKASTAEIPDKLARELVNHYTGELSETTDLLFDLAAAVNRQAKFVDKMCHMLWLRSPAITHTLENARTRYGNFFALFQRYPGKLIVPTLDIDLVWHTHQLSPTEYHGFCTKEAGRFINHDDKIGKGKLDDSFGEVKGLYYREFATAYQICLCWDCEAIREAIARTPPKDDKELETLMMGVRKKVADYRAAEIARRPCVRRNPKETAARVTADDIRAEIFSSTRGRRPELLYR